MITTINCLIPKHDYSKDNCYLIFYHNEKPTVTKEIKVEWFDLNHGEKVLWLLVRECIDKQNNKAKYRNIKYKNIVQKVKVVPKNQEKGDEMYNAKEKI